MILKYFKRISLARWITFFMIMVICVVPRNYSMANESSMLHIINSLDLKNMEITDVLRILSQKSGINFVASQNVKGRLNIFLEDVTVLEALDIIVEMNGLAYRRESHVVKVYTATDFEHKFGHVFGAQMETESTQLLHIETKNIEPVLNDLKSSKGKIIVDPLSKILIITDEQPIIARMRKLIERMDRPLTTSVFELNHAQVSDLKDRLKELVDKETGRIHFDEPSNSFVVTDLIENIEYIAKVVKAFDQKQAEVHIEAKIVQVVLNENSKMGVDWEGIVSRFHGLTFQGNLDALNAADKFGRVSIGSLETDNYTALLEALDSVGETNILSNPRITTIHNHEAKILVGSTEPYVTSTTTTPSSGPATTAENVNFIEVGVKLYVTPKIHRDRYITMKIRPEVSSVTRNVVTANNNTIPVVETSEAETTVVVKDQSTIIIGGLIKDESIDSRRQIPVFGRIPVMGMVFRNTEELLRKTEIVIFLTPRIVEGHNDQFAMTPP